MEIIGNFVNTQILDIGNIQFISKSNIVKQQYMKINFRIKYETIDIESNFVLFDIIFFPELIHNTTIKLPIDKYSDDFYDYFFIHSLRHNLKIYLLPKCDEIFNGKYYPSNHDDSCYIHLDNECECSIIKNEDYGHHLLYFLRKYNKLNCAIIWKYINCPIDLKLSQNGGDEDLLIYIPPNVEYDHYYSIVDTILFDDDSSILIISHS